MGGPAEETHLALLSFRITTNHPRFQSRTSAFVQLTSRSFFPNAAQRAFGSARNKQRHSTKKSESGEIDAFVVI